MILPLYFEDILLTRNILEIRRNQKLNVLHFEMNDMGEAGMYLELEPRGITKRKFRLYSERLAS